MPVWLKLDIYKLLKAGVYGPNANAANSYLDYLMMHGIHQTMIQIASLGKTRRTKPETFNKLFPIHYASMVGMSESEQFVMASVDKFTRSAIEWVKGR